MNDSNNVYDYEKGQILRCLRREKNETQDNLAELLSVKRQAIGYYENGERTPSIKHLITLSKHFNVTIEFLLGLDAHKTGNLKKVKYKIYIAGSITGNPNYEEQFKRAEEMLISKGYAVLNPIKNQGFGYKDYIDMGLCELMKCDAIYVLSGSENSKGVELEKQYARTVGMPLIYEEEKRPK